LDKKLLNKQPGNCFIYLPILILMSSAETITLASIAFYHP
jgi:hypothetical protein